MQQQLVAGQTHKEIMKSNRNNFSTYTRLQPTKNGYRLKTIKRKATNATVQKHNLLERTLGFWLLVGTIACSWTIHLGSVQAPISAYGESVISETRIESDTSIEPLEVPQATVSAEIITTEKEQIIAYIVEVFKEDAPDAFNVLFCENRGLNPRAVNLNKNGTRDLGIFQLNDAYWGGEENFDWKLNIDKAHKIFEKQGWKPWTCSTRVNVKNYLNQ